MHSLPSIPASRAAATERLLRALPIVGYISQPRQFQRLRQRLQTVQQQLQHTREADKDSAYCWVHRPSKSSTKSSTSYSSKSSYSSSYSSSKKSYKTYDSYDDGYDAIYDDDDYDEDRYDSDPDYAAGVDDAMDELDW